MLWLALAAAGAVILFASRYLARSADVIAERTGLGRSFVGVLMLATATSLPELGTGVSSIALVDSPDLAAGDAFGSNLFNLLIIAILDLVWRNGPILNAVSPTALVVGAAGIVVISITSLAMVFHGTSDVASTWIISPVSVLLLGVFAFAMFLIYKHDGGGEAEEPRYEGESLTKAFLTYALAAAVVVVAAVGLAQLGDRIAEEMGWGETFVGTQFLALSTSLPELATSYAAIRLGAPDLAITNLLGSNLFNMGLVLFADDATLTSGPLWRAIDDVHQLTAVVAVVMTAVVILGLAFGRRRRPSKYFTWEALALIGLYAVASVLVFSLT